MYYNKDGLELQEQANTDYYQRKYLTKYIPDNEINTLLPPGNIVFSVLIKDEKETKTVNSQTIKISKSEFDISKYKDFLNVQVENIKIFEHNAQYEEMLCAIGMVIECIADFESIDNTLIEEVIDIKSEKLLKRLLKIPFLIPNDLISQQLQEYALRCLDQLLKTKFVQSSQIKFDQLYSIIDEKVQKIKLLNLKDQDVKETYQRQMFVALDMICQYIKEINQAPQDLITWNEKQISTFSKIQSILAETLNINQQKIEWKSDLINIIVHKVDSQILIKEYLKQQKTKLVYYDQLIYYDVQQQYWAQNIYANHDKFKEQIALFYKNVTENIKQELDRIYPAINMDIISNYDKIFEKRILVKTDQLILPDNSQIMYKFDQVKGNGVVVCTQKISDVWSTKQCKTSVQKNGSTFNVVCICPEPTYTTLMYDLETLFETENVKDIFSEEGINNIFSLDNWYEYAAIYTIILINIGLVIGIVLASKIDKLGIQNLGILMPQTPLISVSPLNDEISSKDKASDFKLSLSPIIEPSIVSIQKDKNKLDVVNNKELCNSDSEISKKQISSQSLITNSNQNNKMDEVLVTNKIYLGKVTNVDEIKKQQHTSSETEIRKCFVESDNKGEHDHCINDPKISNSKKDKKEDKKMSPEKCNEIKKKCHQYLKQLPKLKAIGVFHSLFQIFLIFNDKKSRVFRMCIYYSKLAWLLAINATFGTNISASQVILLSVIGSVTFGVYKFIFSMLQKKKVTIYFSYFLFVCFIIFCYYGILVSMSNSQPSDSNIWILSYFCTLLLDVLIIELITSIVKLILTNKLILSLHPTSIVFSIIGADVIIKMFE